MFKKSQLTSIIMIYIFIVIIVGLTLLLSISAIRGFNTSKKEAEIDTFVFTLEKTMKQQVTKPSGSMNPVTLSLPPNIEKVCFVENNEKFSPHTSSELTKEKELYVDKNLFFFPQNTFAPVNIEYIKLDEAENPLCVKTPGGKLSLRLTSLKDKTLVEAVNYEDITQGCIIVPGSEVGNPDEKIDIVFLNFGYDNKTLFAEDVHDYANNYLLDIEPFSANKEKINLWMIDEEQPDCSIKEYVFCDSLSVNKLASNCPNDYVFILADKLSLNIRSSAVSNMAKINTRDNRLVLLHEFGHTFGNLADEYTDKYYESWFDAKKYKNCDYPGCDSWSSVNGTECIKGCSTNRFYRSIETSIMRNYDRSNEFGVLNDLIINEKLEAYR